MWERNEIEAAIEMFLRLHKSREKFAKLACLQVIEKKFSCFIVLDNNFMTGKQSICIVQYNKNTIYLSSFEMVN